MEASSEVRTGRTQSLDVHVDNVSLTDPPGLNDAAEHDDPAGGQVVSSYRLEIRQPDQRLQWVPVNDVTAVTRADMLSVNLHSSVHTSQVKVVPRGNRLPEHNPGAEKIVCNPGIPIRHAGRKVDVPVINDFDRGMKRLDGFRDAIDGMRCVSHGE